MPHLFSPITIRGVKIRNRIGVTPMCQYSCADGFVNDWHFVHLGSRAAGGAGLVIMEATAVEARGRISPKDAGIWSDEHVDNLRRLVGFIEGQGAVAGIQIAHAGRKAGTSPPTDGAIRPLSDAEGGWEPVAPSPLPYGPDYRQPHELGIEEIRSIQASFRDAAARAHEAGFRLLELHAAHGYLAHSFHSPLSNQRSDDYGGSRDNRMRFTIETVREIRKTWPEDKPLSVRLSCSDWADGGWGLEDSIALASRLKWEGVDIIDCSSGGTVHGLTLPVGPSWQVPFAESIRRKSGIATMAVGMLIEPMQADAVIRNNRVDIVLIGREMLRNPYWPYHAAKTLRKLSLLQFPPQYAYAVIDRDK